MLKSRSVSVLTRYVISYLSVAMLSCLLISSVFLYSYLTNLAQQQEASYTEKAQLIANDLQSQMETLLRVSHKLSIDTLYRADALLAFKYNEIRMLEDFKRYQGYSPLTKEGFLLYRGDASVFLTTNMKADAAMYLASLGAFDPQALLARLHAVESTLVYADQASDLILVAFPMGSPKKREATLAFWMDKTQFVAHIKAVSGLGEETVRVSYQSACVFDFTEPDGARAYGQTTRMSADGAWTVEVSYARSARIPDRLRGFLLIMILGVLFAVAAIAVAIAHRNYSPIRRLVAAHALSPAAPGNDEIRAIEGYIRRLGEASAQAREALTANNTLLRRKLFQLLLNGVYTDQIKEQFAQLDIRLEGPWFCTLLIRLTPKPDAADLATAEMIRLMDDLSDESSQLYTAYDEGAGGYAVLVSMRERDEWIELDSLISDALNAKGVSGRFAKGGVYGSLSRVSSSYLEALMASNDEADTNDPEGGPLEGKNAWLHGSEPDRIVSAIKAGALDEARQCLVESIANLEANGASMLLMRFAFSRIAMSLADAAHALGFDIPESTLYAMVSATTRADFKEAALDFLRQVESKRDRGGASDDAAANGVLRYIQEHIEQYNLSLEFVAGELGMSTTRVSGIVKSATGMYYKDYIIRLRIAKAKTYLRDGSSVAETCLKIGYGNISHFIKTFKALEGITPGEYLRRHAEEA